MHLPLPSRSLYIPPANIILPPQTRFSQTSDTARGRRSAPDACAPLFLRNAPREHHNIATHQQRPLANFRAPYTFAPHCSTPIRAPHNLPPLPARWVRGCISRMYTASARNASSRTHNRLHRSPFARMHFCIPRPLARRPAHPISDRPCNAHPRPAPISRSRHSTTARHTWTPLAWQPHLPRAPMAMPPRPQTPPRVCHNRYALCNVIDSARLYVAALSRACICAAEENGHAFGHAGMRAAQV